MTGDDDKPNPDEERTVFMPAPGTGAAAPTPPAWGSGVGGTAPGTPPPVDWGAPAAQPPATPDWGAASPPPPGGGWGGPTDRETTAPGVSPAPAMPTPDQTAFNRTYMPMAPRLDGDRIQVGDVLNHIFRVDRFIARGGMGEVFEGSNVNSDERVAIKVMLPALAADPNVQAMFRKEAKTLTRLTHPALVQYRVLAQEPQLNVLYIVTEYIDGKNLADVLGALKPSGAELVALTRRLADGLRVAHGLGAIHRDISPDNVLLEDGRLDKAKIIDFGIAKDLDPSSKTIVGDGFAGKLNYVAPEQLGDFGRDVGPWSDVYSLGLVLLAVAMGRNVEMGATLVDAVDKRRAGPDISAVPAELQPVLAKMLVPNPAERLRSMEEVIAALDGGVRPIAAGAGGGAAGARTSHATATSDEPKSKTPLLIGGGIAALLVIAAGGWFAMSGGNKAAPAGAAGAGGGSAVTAAAGPVDEVARTAIDTALPSISCTWLDIADVLKSQGGVSVTFTGVAGTPGRAQGAISKAVEAKGIQATDINFDQVATVPASMCDALDAFRGIRVANPTQLSTAQREWELRRPDGGGEKTAEVVLRVDLGPPSSEAAIYGLQESGEVSKLASTRAEFEQFAAAQGWKNEGGNVWRVSLFVTHQGWSGLLLLTGKGPFDDKLITAPEGQRGPSWEQKFASDAKAGGWKAEMVWFKTTDKDPS